MTDIRPDRQTRRVLTAAELQTIHTAIDDATGTAAVLAATISSLYTILVADTDPDRCDDPDADPIDPTAHAIPATQWQAIATMATNRAAAWGTTGHLGLDLVNLMPSHYDDPQTPAPDLTLADYRPAAYDLHLSRTAVDVIATCEAHIAALGEHYGPHGRIHLDALRSWHHALAGILRADIGTAADIGADGPQSLYVATTSLHYGVIFHGARRACTTSGCHTAIDDDGTVRPAYPGATVTDHTHTPSYPLEAPQPGTWSVHS